MSFWAAVLGAALGSSVATAGVNQFGRWRADHRARLGSKTDDARDAVAALELVFRGVHEQQNHPDEMTHAEAKADQQIDKCGDKRLKVALEAWKVVGRQWAARSDDTSEESFRQALAGVRDRLIELMKKL